MPHPSQRLWELDALRGLMLVLMTLTHMPTMFSSPLGQPFGFVSAAEGFVFLSAYMAGKVYSGKARRHGMDAMRHAFHQRVGKLYLCQLGLVALAFTVIAWLGVHNQQGGATGLLEFFFIDRTAATLGALLLLHNPPLLDILPLYIFFMAVSPWLVRQGLQKGWRGLLMVSGLLWLAEQWGLGYAVYRLANSVVTMPIPHHEMGAFRIFAWQLLWVAGLWLGARQKPLPTLPWPALVPLVAFSLVTLVWRHMVGQDPMPGVPAVGALFDKWALGPLRLANFASLLVLLIAAGPWLKRTLPRPLPLELLGRSSLSVFCAHVVIAMLTLAFFGSIEVWRPWTTDVVLMLGAFAGLFATALAVEARDRGGLRWLPLRSGHGPQMR